MKNIKEITLYNKNINIGFPPKQDVHSLLYSMCCKRLNGFIFNIFSIKLKLSIIRITFYAYQVTIISN